MGELITIYRSKNAIDVYAAQAILERENIESFRKDEFTTQTAPYLTNGIQLQVQKDDLVRAIEVLQGSDYITPTVSEKNNPVKQVIIFIVFIIIVFSIFLWIRKYF